MGFQRELFDSILWHRFQHVECFEKISELRDRVHPELKVFTHSIIRIRSDRLRWEETLKPFGIELEFRGWMNLAEAATTPKEDQSDTNCGICHWMSEAYNLYVTATGDVVPCCLHPRAGVLGSLLKDKYPTIRRGDARHRAPAKQTRITPKPRLALGHRFITESDHSARRASDPRVVDCTRAFHPRPDSRCGVIATRQCRSRAAVFRGLHAPRLPWPQSGVGGRRGSGRAALLW